MTKKKLSLIDEERLKLLIFSISSEKELISEARGRLRDLMDELETIIDITNDADDLLKGAIERLSEYL